MSLIKTYDHKYPVLPRGALTPREFRARNAIETIDKQAVRILIFPRDTRARKKGKSGLVLML